MKAFVRDQTPIADRPTPADAADLWAIAREPQPVPRTWPHRQALAAVSLWLGGLLTLVGASAIAAADPVDVVTQDVTRFTRLLESPLPERRVEGIQGLSNLKHWPAETTLLKLLADPALPVRREAVQALGRLGSASSVPRLVDLLSDSSWELRQNAWLNLGRLTAQDFPIDQPQRWRQWWTTGAATNHAATLLARLTNAAPSPARQQAWRAFRHFATPANEEFLIASLHKPDLTSDERLCVAAALERVGSAKAIPALAGFHADAAAWALGRIGGTEAEQALLKFPKTLGVLLNLDRLHSTNCGWLVPHLVSQMGLVTYRGQPDDLMNADAQPIQRVGANLILRSGRAPELIHQVLLELEYTMKPPPASPRPATPQEWKPMLEAMRSELKPGFVREDGTTTSQPLAALYHLAADLALVPRLRPLLRHPAFVPRIYVAMTLGKLQAAETLPELLAIIREGYAFSDSVALASGKHFDQSQTVRWRGFLCLALGRMGGDAARRALEELAADARQPRDIRYSSVVGLGFIGSAQSLPVLRSVATNDIIWMVRDEARRTANDIATLQREAQP